MVRIKENLVFRIIMRADCGEVVANNNQGRASLPSTLLLKSLMKRRIALWDYYLWLSDNCSASTNKSRNDKQPQMKRLKLKRYGNIFNSLKVGAASRARRPRLMMYRTEISAACLLYRVVQHGIHVRIYRRHPACGCHIMVVSNVLVIKLLY